MKHTVEKISPSRVKIAASVEKDLWQQAQEKSFNKLAKQISVPGFRPGKAPRKLVEERVNQERLFNEAIEEVLNPVFASVITEEKITPMYRPEVGITKLSKDELELTYTCVLVPEVKLGAYKGLKAEKKVAAVKDSEVNEAIENLLKGNAELVLVERPAKLGDTVIIDFNGFIKDEEGKLKEFEGGKADNYSLELGSHQFIPGFEEAVVGMKDGDKKDINVTFPANYVKELAGKEATFKIVMHEVKEKKVPELTDEAVKELNIKDVTTVEGLKEYEKKTILEKKVQESEAAYYNEIVSQVVKNATFVIDPIVIENEAGQMQENLKKQIEQNGLTFAQYLEITGTKEEDLKKTNLENAEKNIKEFLALHQVGIEEKLLASDAELDSEIKKMAEQYKMKEEEVRSIVMKNDEQFRNQITDRKIKEFLIAHEEKKSPSATAEKKSDK